MGVVTKKTPFDTSEIAGKCATARRNLAKSRVFMSELEVFRLSPVLAPSTTADAVKEAHSSLRDLSLLMAVPAEGATFQLVQLPQTSPLMCNAIPLAGGPIDCVYLNANSSHRTRHVDD